MCKKQIILIPAYQPNEVLLNLVKEIKEHPFDVVVVNDGSDDAHCHIFLQLEPYAHIISYPKNRGKGYALKEGLSYIREHYSCEYTVVTVDADGQHKLPDILRVCEEAANHPDTLVLGSRKQSKHSPLRSRFGNWVTRNVYRLVAGLHVYDTQTGLRAFSHSLTEQLSGIAGERYEYEMNVLLFCARKKIPMKEIAIETVYLDGNASSHFNKIKDSYRVYKEILKFALSSLAGFLIDYAIYSILLFSGSRVLVANIIARIISATANYTINAKLVFHKKGRSLKSISRYALLALCILVGNTLVLGYITKEHLMDPYLAKFVTELIFSIGSFIVQKCFVFKKRGSKKRSN